MTLVLVVFVGSVAMAQGPAPPDVPFGAPPVPPSFPEVTIDEQLGERVATGLSFVDPNGEVVTFDGLFDGDRPVVLVLNYYNCPMMCGLIMKGLSKTTQELVTGGFEPGDEFRIVSVSIDPDETPTLAGQNKESFLDSLEDQRAAVDASAVQFLTQPDEAVIQSLTDSVGYTYKYLETKDEYVHPSAIIVLSPEGQISRYFPGISYPSRDVRFALIEASEGRVGSAMDRLLLMTCFQFDAEAGQYTWTAKYILSGAAALMVIGMFIGFLYLRVLEKRRMLAFAAGE